MTIYTSYYAWIAKHLDKDYCLIQISNSSPAWFPYGLIPLSEVYPPWKIVSEWKYSDQSEASWERYCKAYHEEVLSRFTKEELLTQLESISAGRDVVLLCYEARNKPCHRHVLGDFIGGVEL